MDNNIFIKSLSLNQLREELSKKKIFENQEYIPITAHRAISHVNNPRAESDDILLYVAYEKNQICGYVGMLPDYLFAENGKEKIAWLTAWWVSPRFVGKGIGYSLLNKAIETYRNRIFAISASADSLRIFRKCGEFNLFTHEKSNDYIFSYPNVPPKNIISIAKNGVFKIVNAFARKKLQKWVRKNIYNDFIVDEVTKYTCDLSSFIEANSKNTLFNRSSPEFEWITKYPWVLSGKISTENERFYFSSHAESFLYREFIVKSNNEIVCFIMLRFRDNFVSIPYLFFKNEHIKDIEKIIAEIVFKYKIKSLTIKNQHLAKAFEELKLPFIKNIEFNNEIIVPKQYDYLSFEDFNLQDGMGDNVFT